jgi:hypothetical protein
VLVLKPFVAGLADPQRAWLTVAMASTLAGNFTLVGSVANLIVAERARAGRRRRLLALLPGWCAIDAAHASLGYAVGGMGLAWAA